MSATSNRDETSQGTTASFVTAIVTGLIVFAAEMAVYVWFHSRDKKVYQPRTYLVEEGKRAPELPSNPIKWFSGIIKASDRDVLRTNGLDAYSFVRFIKLLIKMSIPFWLLTWIVLMPLTAVAPTKGQTGLNIFTIGNVGETVQARLAGHLVVCWFLTAFLFYLIFTEVKHFIDVRHEFLSSPEHVAKMRSRTVLVTGVPKDMMTEAAMQEYASSSVQGGADRVWLVRDVTKVEDEYDEREDACNKLEGAEGKLLALAAKRIRKGKASAPGEQKEANEGGHRALIDSIVPIKKRPTHRLGKIPFFGTKVDTIDWSTSTIKEKNELLAKLREHPEHYDLSSSAIIRFHSQTDAIAFAQDRPKALRKKVGSTYPDVARADIVWKNLGINSKVAKGRAAIGWALTIGLILIWTIPVAFVGTLSNLSSLCQSVSFLSWLCKLPSPVVGIIQGAAPPVGLAVLFILLPIVLRLFAKQGGIPLKTAIEKSVFERYWLFLIIHGFLIVTVSGSLTSALPGVIENPQNAPSILAGRLPSSSIFFLTYLIATGLSMAAGALSQAVAVAIQTVMRLLGGSTPRKIYTLEHTLKSILLTQVWPNVSLLAVLTIVYSIIQPVICLLGVVVFFLYYLAYKYLFIWVYEQPSVTETGGLFFPKGINHLFVGLYIEQICLIGLFFLSSNAAGNRSAAPEGALMVVLLILTILFQLYIKFKLKPKKIQIERLSSHHEDSSYENGSKETNGYANGANGHSADREEHEADEEKRNRDIHAFDPPSMHEGQQVIWIANDSHGLAQHEAAKIRENDVEASTDNAEMDAKGKVTVEVANLDRDYLSLDRYKEPKS